MTLEQLMAVLARECRMDRDLDLEMEGRSLQMFLGASLVYKVTKGTNFKSY